MAALAMSGAPPPLPSRDGRPPSNTLPRRASAHAPSRTQYQISSPRHRRPSEDELPPPPPRSRNDPLPPVPPSIQNLPRQDDLPPPPPDFPPPPPRGKQDPLPPPPPSIGTMPHPRGNQPRQGSQYTSQTLPRNARSDTNLQSTAEKAAPRLPPRRNASLHGGHAPSAHNHVTNGSIPQRILENVGMYFALETLMIIDKKRINVYIITDMINYISYETNIFTLLHIAYFYDKFALFFINF